MAPSAGELALVERQFVSNFAVEVLGIQVHVSGALTDVDAQVAYSVVNEASEEIRAGIAQHPDTGTYEFALTSAETAVPGLYLVYWDYRVGGTPQTQETYYEVGQRAPDYDALPTKAKSVVENVYWRFADLFDSPIGGPHLQVYVQTNFGRQRLAQALRASLNRLNVWAQPIMTYSFDGSHGGKEYPYDQWGGVLEQALYCVDPTTPVLRDDLQWVPVGELEVGDRLVAFDEEIVGGKFRTAEVLANQLEVKPRVRVSTSMGEVITTPDHRFVVRYPVATSNGRTTYKRRWMEAQNLRPGVDEIVSVGEPWGHREDYSTGYLAGMMDGEGCLTFTPQSRDAESYQSRLFFSQKPGLVMDKAKDTAKALGFEMAESAGSHANVLHLRGGMTEQMRFLGTVRPVRLLDHPLLSRIWEGRAMRQQALPSAHVLSVEPMVEGPVSVMQTSTGTFIANGLLSHNCEVLKHLRRSYVEQPTPEGVSLARLDRRDYMDRWGTILADEQRELDTLIEQFKIAHMGLGTPSALISGGAYGYWGPTRLVGAEVARPHYWAVWH